jgi:hypothetical protein
MAYASISGRARTSSRNPQAHAICDRCGGRFNHVDLRWQYEWRGATLQNIRVLVCQRCLDVPQQNLRAIVLPADPTPIINARTEPFCIDETNFLMVTGPPDIDPVTGIQKPRSNFRTTLNNLNRTVNPYGIPVGLTPAAVMPYDGATQQIYGVPLQILSVTSAGHAVITVTCSVAHGMTTGKQIAVSGLSYNDANGFFSVTVLSAMAFTYMTYGSIPPLAMLTPTTRIITALVGLPCDYDQIPQITGGPLIEAFTIPLLELEDGIDLFLLQDGSTFIELQEGI